MYTQCPECDSYFRIRQDQLQAARGKVRCSVCKTTFNAREHLLDKIPGQKPEPATPERDSRTPDLFEHSDRSQEQDQDPPTEEGSPSPLWLTEEAEPETTESHALLWTAGSIVMLVILALQLLHSEREYWAQHERFGDWVTAAYERIGAGLPDARSLDALDIQRADIAGHADDDRVLRVTAVVENNSDEEQPLPAVYIRLEDRWGLNMGAGFFRPEEWVHRETLPDGFAPRERLPLRVDLRDPSQEAVSFHMELCWIEQEGFACKAQRGGAAFTR